ncbi:unnamed protein product [Xylocopa violacea]|uniref:Uncharacterized protein n=1 Tax=Xylocopa violacea TaxID=135666 RepID=A0ABP1NB25_XYLVO
MKVNIQGTTDLPLVFKLQLHKSYASLLFDFSYSAITSGLGTSNSYINKENQIIIISNERDKENIFNKIQHGEDSISVITKRFTGSRTSTKQRKKRELPANFIDKISNEEINGFNTILSIFFFEYNISFNVTESDHFENLHYTYQDVKL